MQKRRSKGSDRGSKHRGSKDSSSKSKSKSKSKKGHGRHHKRDHSSDEEDEKKKLELLQQQQKAAEPTPEEVMRRARVRKNCFAYWFEWAYSTLLYNIQEQHCIRAQCNLVSKFYYLTKLKQWALDRSCSGGSTERRERSAANPVERGARQSPNGGWAQAARWISVWTILYSYTSTYLLLLQACNCIYRTLVWN